MEALIPAGLLPSRSVGPEPGMIKITGADFVAGVSSVPVSCPVGPGAYKNDSDDGTCAESEQQKKQVLRKAKCFRKFIGSSDARMFSLTGGVPSILSNWTVQTEVRFRPTAGPRLAPYPTFNFERQLPRKVSGSKRRIAVSDAGLL